MSETHAHSLPAGHRIGEYEIVRVLGAGGFGITYLAFDLHLDGPVVVKEYFPAGFAVRIGNQRVIASSPKNHETYAWGLGRFIEEARAVHRFRHQNVVRVHRFVEAHGTAYIVMEYVEGESLEAILESRGRLSTAEWRPWMDRLLDGLEDVHGQRYLHRDIKPGNIVVRAADGEPVLIDFGAARVDARERTHTRVLTPEYAPIEQHSSDAAQGSFTDIYALAAVSYRVVTGEAPPSAPDRMLDDQCEPLARRLADTGADWLAAIDYGLALRPEDRPQTVAAWRRALGPATFDTVDIVIHAVHAAQDRVGWFSLNWLRWAGKLGSVAAQRALAEIYDHYKSWAWDWSEAAAWLRMAAEQGHADSQSELGFKYTTGLGVAEDHVEAVTWYRKAAEQGYSPAQVSLGHMYEKGDGVNQDFLEAAAWYRRAAQQGDASAQNELGRMYENGRGVARDYLEAALWYRKAAEQDHLDAQNNLGRMYEHGRGVDQDRFEAEAWYRKAAGRHHK